MAARKKSRSRSKPRPAPAPSLTAFDKKFQRENDARTLREAEEIRSDSGRRRAAKGELNRIARDAERAKRKL